MMFGSLSANNQAAWSAHRQVLLPPNIFGPSPNAMYASNTNSYGEAPISDSNRNCYLFRDPNAGATNNMVPNSTVLWDGDVWYYTNYGSGVYYDQCQLYASQHGASIITPQTIGLDGDNYWICSIYFGTNQYFTLAGTSMLSEQPYSSRSTARSCMVGLCLLHLIIFDSFI